MCSIIHPALYIFSNINNMRKNNICTFAEILHQCWLVQSKLESFGNIANIVYYLDKI